MASKLWIVFALVYLAKCHVIKSVEEVVPPEGMLVEVIIKPNTERLAFGDSGKRVQRRAHDVVVPPLVSANQPKGKENKNVEPQIENRFGIRGGMCPSGYVRRGGFCFPDYD